MFAYYFSGASFAVIVTLPAPLTTHSLFPPVKVPPEVGHVLELVTAASALSVGGVVFEASHVAVSAVITSEAQERDDALAQASNEARSA